MLGGWIAFFVSHILVVLVADVHSKSALDSFVLRDDPWSSFVLHVMHLAFDGAIALHGDGFSTDEQRVAFYTGRVRLLSRRPTFLCDR